MSLADTAEPVMLLAVPGDDLFISNCCAIALTALLFHDFLITVDDEIRCIWKRKFTGATFLFLANRYVGLLYRLVTMLLLVPWSTKARGSADEICTGIFRLSEALGLILEIVYAGITALRVYAIWRLNRRILFGTMVLGLSLPCLEIVYYTRISVVALQPPYPGCGIRFEGGTSRLKFGLSVTIRIVAVLLHTLVLVLTWIRTSNVNTFLAHWKFHSSLSLLLLRDGALYFVVLVVLNVIDLIELIRSGGLMNPASTIVITSILMSRFMLNLRNVDMQGMQVCSSHIKPASEIRFASSVVGNLGAPLDIGEIGRLGSAGDDSRRASMVSLRAEFSASGDAFVMGLVDEALLDEGSRGTDEQPDEEFEDDDFKGACGSGDWFE